ncbi:hypothetical protein LTS15_009482 [Exophiala xenobiotica]|nr:hypothetical protein LTS15_009482 [Exophiala xenobiotica]
MEPTAQGYRWMNNAISKLDPEKDYETIWRIMTGYKANDFMNNLIYALTFPNFVVTENGARAVWREDGGKVLNKAILREEETDHTNATWWYYGPSDERCVKAISKINDLHARWAKVYPGDFSDNTDYIYTLAFSAVLMHRLRERMHLSGFSEKEKIAAHHFWRDMSYHFLAENGKPLHGYPEDWDGLISYCEAFENTPREGTERGHLIAETIYESFAFRFFPPSLRWLGKSMPIALSLPTTLQAHKIKPINPILKAIIVFFVACFFWIGENVMPDPKVAFWPTIEGMSAEELRARKIGITKIDKEYAPYFASKHATANQWAGCPYHEAMRKVAPASFGDEKKV